MIEILITALVFYVLGRLSVHKDEEMIQNVKTQVHKVFKSKPQAGNLPFKDPEEWEAEEEEQ